MTKRIGIGFLGLVLIGIIGYLYYEVHQLKKMAMIDVIRLFNEFDMKKDLEEVEKLRLSKLRKEVDSFENVITIIQQSKKTPDKLLIEQYSSSKFIFEEEYKNGNQTLNEQIWKRLNPLLDEYGKQKGFNLLIGANGMGTVLYHTEYFDVTSDALEFVNKKYAQK